MLLEGSELLESSAANILSVAHALLSGGRYQVTTRGSARCHAIS